MDIGGGPATSPIPTPAGGGEGRGAGEKGTNLKGGKRGESKRKGKLFIVKISADQQDVAPHHQFVHMFNLAISHENGNHICPDVEQDGVQETGHTMLTADPNKRKERL
jgi:hypothetical protein